MNVPRFADAQTADMLNLPRPRLECGKPHVIVCLMSDDQRDIQMQLVARYERLRSQKIDPREDTITTDGRKLAVDARMLLPAAPDYPNSKINAMVDRVVSIWTSTESRRGRR